MAGINRHAQVVWTGNLTEGAGRIVGASSGSLNDLDVTWASRTEEPQGKTSPEELIAAAHASCFAMGLSAGLARGGNEPKQLNIDATSTLVMEETGPRVAAMHFDVRGQVDGIDDAAFAEAAQQAAENCPVSKALKGNVEVTVEARLDPYIA